MAIVILMAVCAAYVLVDLICLAQRLNKFIIWIASIRWNIHFVWFNRKPFNCKECLSGWATLPLTINHYPPLQVVYIMALAMVASVVFNILLFKL